MINNRQGGRRRGRGGQRERGQNLGGGQPGNRQDNRQRGNAAQLLEKYKSMARDSQLAGDRVQTEYFLQFADHYYRVLGESRARFEEQNPRRSRDDEMDDDDDNGASLNDQGFRGDDDDGGDDMMADERPERAERPERPERPSRNERFNRPSRERGNERLAEEDDGRGPRRPRANGGDDSLPLDVLPPAIGRDQPAASANPADDEEPPRPRRRARSARPVESDDGTSPAS